MDQVAGLGDYSGDYKAENGMIFGKAIRDSETRKAARSKAFRNFHEFSQNRFRVTTKMYPVEWTREFSPIPGSGHSK